MVLVNAFATPLMLSSVNVALPSIAKDLSMNAVQISWIPMAYLMAGAMFVLMFGKIADTIGRKRIYLIGTAFVVITSVIAANSHNPMFLIITRFLQGLSAAMLYATQVAIISSAYPPEKRGRFIGLTVSMIYLGLAMGTLLGGYVVEYFGWRLSFLIHIPLAISAFFIGVFFVKDEWKSQDKVRIDVFGMSMYMISIFTFCYGATHMPTAYGFTLLSLAIVGFLCFIFFETKHKHPIFDINLFFSNRVFTFSCMASFIMYTATFANMVQISLYLQYLKELPASYAGMIMLCQPITMALLSPLTGLISDKIEPKVLATIGMLISCIGLVMLSALKQSTDIYYLVISLIITGIGFSLFSSPNVNAIMSSVENKVYSSANSILAMMRILGQLASTIVITFVFTLIIGKVNIETDNFYLLEKAISSIFIIAAILCALGMNLSIARGKLR